MSENLSDLIKNPVILGVAGVACIVIVALIIRSSTSQHDIAKVESEKNVNTEKTEKTEIKETFIFDKKDEEIIEYFPAPEMNVMYSDASGNLATTRDLGLSNLTVTGASQLQGNLAIGPSGKFVFQPGTDDWLRLVNASAAYGTQGLAATNLWAQNFYGSPRFRDSGITVDGLITSNGGYSMLNNRVVKPNHLAGHRVQFGFGGMSNSDSAPFADYIHFNGWGDASGQSPNLVMFNKGSIGMRIYQGAFNADTAYSQYMDAVMADSSGNVNSGSVRATLSDGLCQFRAKHGNRGTMFRQDGDDFYILTTAINDANGGWNNLRPFYINNASGNVTMGHNVGVGGALTAGSISTGGAASVTGVLSTGGEIKTDSNLAIGPSRKFVFQPGTDDWLRLVNASAVHGTLGLAAANLWAEKIHGNPNFIHGLSVTGNASFGGNIVTNRGRISFMNATDLNHTIYNNYTNTDNEGIWDGMKMNTYRGLDIRTGDANSTSKKTMVEVRDGSVSIAGELKANDLKAKTFWVKKNNYLYYPEDAKIYENIFDALNEGVIYKFAHPIGWNQTTWKTARYPDNDRGKVMLCIGSKNVYPDGLRVDVPSGKRVIWVRCINGDRWTSIQVYKINLSDGSGANLGTFVTGMRSGGIQYTPDGGTSDWNTKSDATSFHRWMPIPVPSDGPYALIYGNSKNNEGPDGGWLSDFAFSSNPWNHAMNSGKAYEWSVNEGSPAYERAIVNEGSSTVSWNSYFPNSNVDQLVHLDAGTGEKKTYYLKVPIVPSGKDKLFYMIEHDNFWDGSQHKGIYVVKDDDPSHPIPIERMRSTWDHPLARSINSKAYNRFLASRLPADLIGDNARFITIMIDMTNMGQRFHFREAGTIDMY